MAISVIPVIYKASDGTEFKDKQEAERHDAIITAESEFKDAQRKYGRLLAESQKTADGKPFTFGGLRGYYYVRPAYWGWPEIEDISFDPWHFHYDNRDGFVIHFHYDNRDGFVIHVHGMDGKTREYRVSQLYRDRRAADMALLEARERRLAELTEIVGEERARLYPAAAEPES